MNVCFDHLLSLSDEIGTFEHTEFDVPRRDHGYCTDDVARVVVAVQRQPHRTDELRILEAQSIFFVLDAQDAAGRTRNRRGTDGRWTGTAEVGDCWGRSLWALGSTAANGSTGSTRELALHTFERCATQHSPSPRALAFASFGAALVAGKDPSNRSALNVMAQFAHWFDSRPTRAGWPWPEERLAYANAAICDALIAVGQGLGRLELTRCGLDLLGWLLDHETSGSHLSVTPVGGVGPEGSDRRFDQQPIEVASLADACVRAFDATFDARWLDEVGRCVAWFEGGNDVDVQVWDPVSGAGFDGLTPDGINRNCGAESTLAAITTAQAGAYARRVMSIGR